MRHIVNFLIRLYPRQLVLINRVVEALHLAACCRECEVGVGEIGICCPGLRYKLHLTVGDTRIGEPCEAHPCGGITVDCHVDAERRGSRGHCGYKTL